MLDYNVIVRKISEEQIGAVAIDAVASTGAFGYWRLPDVAEQVRVKLRSVVDDS